jgi:hypothetical protein
VTSLLNYRTLQGMHQRIIRIYIIDINNNYIIKGNKKFLTPPEAQPKISLTHDALHCERREEHMPLRKVIAPVVVVLGMMGCGTDHPSERTNAPSPPAESPPAALHGDFPQLSFNAVTSASPKYQATQLLSATPQQSLTSPGYVMTVSMF